uniref:Uncharacterized protein n=1 Tax=Triticum urartu TaxID=4572 RepID=A0A8R7UTD9_TRIUA
SGGDETGRPWQGDYCSTSLARQAGRNKSFKAGKWFGCHPEDFGCKCNSLSNLISEPCTRLHLINSKDTLNGDYGARTKTPLHQYLSYSVSQYLAGQRRGVSDSEIAGPIDLGTCVTEPTTDDTAAILGSRRCPTRLLIILDP